MSQKNIPKRKYSQMTDSEENMIRDDFLNFMASCQPSRYEPIVEE
jgi:hypothetical protein